MLCFFYFSLLGELVIIGSVTEGTSRRGHFCLLLYVIKNSNHFISQKFSGMSECDIKVAFVRGDPNIVLNFKGGAEVIYSICYFVQSQH